MLRRILARWLLAACVAPFVHAQTVAPITAAEIVQKNAAARGGTEAWQRLQTMAWTGYVESGAKPGRKLQFLLEQKRPNKTRFELISDGQRSIRMYDGTGGWKLRSNPANGRPELSPYTDDELKFAHGAQVIEGPLMDYVAKGGIVTLAGHGLAEGRNAHILEVKLPSGGMHRVWVDAENFLEVRHDRQVRGGMGQDGMVTVLFRDYREFEGVKIPTQIETGAGAGVSPNRLVIERVALNPDLDDRMFARPDTPVSRRNSIVVDTRTAATPTSPRPAGLP
jgi:outer membrane lipoprotein-sorting protein